MNVTQPSLSGDGHILGPQPGQPGVLRLMEKVQRQNAGSAFPPSLHRPANGRLNEIL